MSTRSPLGLRDKVVGSSENKFPVQSGSSGTMGRLCFSVGLYLFTASAFGTLLTSSLSLAHAHAKGELIVNQKVREERSQASRSYVAPGMVCFPATLRYPVGSMPHTPPFGSDPRWG